MGIEQLIQDGEINDNELRIAVTIESFSNMFGDDWSFDKLINHENITPAWKDIFETWKDRGLLN